MQPPVELRSSKWLNSRIIDWNLVINPEIDTENYRQVNNPTARREVLKLIENEFIILIFIGV